MTIQSLEQEFQPLRSAGVDFCHVFKSVLQREGQVEDDSRDRIWKAYALSLGFAWIEGFTEFLETPSFPTVGLQKLDGDWMNRHHFFWLRKTSRKMELYLSQRPPPVQDWLLFVTPQTNSWAQQPLIQTEHKKLVSAWSNWLQIEHRLLSKKLEGISESRLNQCETALAL